MRRVALSLIGAADPVFRMSDEEAQEVADKIIELARYYGQDDLV